MTEITSSLDLARLVVIVLLFWNAGALTAATFRFGQEFYRSKGKELWCRRLWLARVAIRVGILALIYFAADATLQNWGDPIRFRMVVLAPVLVILPWAHAELVRDILLRRPDIDRRGG